MYPLRKLTERAAAAVLMTAAAALMQSCFTGIESTPRISEAQVQRNTHAGAEELYLLDITPEPPGKWERGKMFMVTEGRLSRAMEGTPAWADSLRGTKLFFQQFRAVSTPTGTGTEVILTTDAGQELRYRTSVHPDSIANAGALVIPFTIDMDMVTAADSRMHGKTYYIKTPAWMIPGTDIRADSTLRHVPVTVDSVTPGDNRYPLMVHFSYQYRQYYVFMSLDAEHGNSRNFPALFSLENPRRRFRQITDAVWNNIIHGRVENGMTREECRLALGTPENVNTQTDHAFINEVWTYPGGGYLIFKDGVLQEFRFIRSGK
ncbi:MAG: hypothetical protein K2M79_01000 [Muribaculaceae bacterium]|nr:hypothetical protein [Muribaculaceae bacterium]